MELSTPVNRSAGEGREEAWTVVIAAALAIASLALYLRTLAPSVATIFDDSLEFQLVGPTLSIAHPTGYPLYTLLAWLFSRIPVGDAAYRVNLLSAVAAAAAVGMVYLAAHQWTGSRLAAAIGSVVFALSPIFWSQATIAEVYALHAFFVALILWVTLRGGDSRLAPSWFLPAACLGFSLAHHRMTLLLVPAVVVFALWTTPSLFLQPRRWPRLAVAFLAPLLLYLYIPLRGLATTSLDGTYRNTWAGFWGWVTASGYNVFLSGNPFGVHYDARFYFNLFLAQFGWVGLVLGTLGFLAMLREPRRWALVALAFAANLAFGLAYRAADVDVFFIPAFLLWAIFVAAGVAVLLGVFRVIWDRFLGGDSRTPPHPYPLSLKGRGESSLPLSDESTEAESPLPPALVLMRSSHASPLGRGSAASSTLSPQGRGKGEGGA
ncbi:MAG: DUF2723 domain-containing protein, partial [Anaerolineae bacterium]|nr:DUF2723 domain-containing protein [Anaerolineae bacterium]